MIYRAIKDLAQYATSVLRADEVYERNTVYYLNCLK